jgi:hypothetical protein
MNRRCILVLILACLMISTCTLNAISQELIKSNKDGPDMDPAQKPAWNLGDCWKYDMEFSFMNFNDNGKEILNIDAEIIDMVAEIDSMARRDNEDLYILDLKDSYIRGQASFLGLFNVGELRGDFSGYAFVGKDNLAMKKFIFEVDGEVKVLGSWKPLYFEMMMTFEPSFDFFEFPIIQDEEPWLVEIEEATLSASVDVMGVHKEYEKSMSFSDLMEIDRTETVMVGEEPFDCYVLKGSWGEPGSNLWYAPAAGFLAKVDERLNWGKGDKKEIIAGFNLELKETNYDISNQSPEAPIFHDGTADGESGIDYAYKVSSTDPNNDKIKFLFDWGDSTTTETSEYYSAGEICEQSHAWSEKGVYNIAVKAIDEHGLVSDWSEPFIVTISGKPNVGITIHYIEQKDQIDYNSDNPELYYEVMVGEKSQRNHNTDNGKYNGIWNDNRKWSPEKTHYLQAENQIVTINISLMDHDEGIEGNSDDLADVSGCNDPDNDGIDDFDGGDNTRKAVYHGTYDLVTGKLKENNENSQEYADYVEELGEPNKYKTSGDFYPDMSTEYEGGLLKDPQNDAEIIFSLSNDYTNPSASINVINSNENLRPGDLIKFRGKVTGGTPEYSWSWDFGDGTTADIQNPEHIYNNAGTYNVILTLNDGFGQTSQASYTIIVNINKNPKIVQFTGDNNGKPNELYEYQASAEDDDGDMIEYKIDWDDGSDTGWLGPYPSGTIIYEKHSWNEKGNYVVKFTVRDSYLGQDSETMEVKMPRKISIYSILFERLQILFPNIFVLLKNILN